MLFIGANCPAHHWRPKYKSHMTTASARKLNPSEERPMVLGIGTDIIEIHRIHASIERFGQRFLDRVFTPGEIDYCQRKQKRSAESFAARFAAKEAAAKALGTGISRGISWKEIEVRRQPGERPTLHLTGRAAARAVELAACALHLSLTHNQSLALATVIAES